MVWFKKPDGRVEELERIVQLAESQGVNIFDVCIKYGFFKELDRISGNNNAYNRTMEFIYHSSK